MDERGIYIVDLTWMTKEQVASEWITRTMPAEQEIIGLRAAFNAKGYITSIGFLPWTPRVQRQKKKSIASKQSFLL